MQKSWRDFTHLTHDFIQDIHEFVTKADEKDLKICFESEGCKDAIHLFTLFSEKEYDVGNKADVIDALLESLCIISDVLPSVRQTVINQSRVISELSCWIREHCRNVHDEHSENILVEYLALLLSLLKNEPDLSLREDNHDAFYVIVSDLLELFSNPDSDLNSNVMKYACACLILAPECCGDDVDNFINEKYLSHKAYGPFIELFLSMFNRSDSIICRSSYLHLIERLVLMQGLIPRTHVMYTNDFYLIIDILLREIRDLYYSGDIDRVLLRYLNTLLILIQSSKYSARDVTEAYKFDEIQQLMKFILNANSAGSWEEDYFFDIKEGSDTILKSAIRARDILKRNKA
ncbi:hypothetical protein AKO1_009261 [Acrasis kona]|uniref:SPIN90/Ldb17 leucine-rich domain-containing protein n=1 Tax=Acrasis kona TaxID=1008807 RepID=A0AAW2ZM71_9EUKA